MIGDQIRQYHILSRLGAGGMGEVFLAEDERLGRRVALKFLAADLSNDEQALERFRNEARLSAGLSHPNIASIHGFEETEGRWFHVHEYVEGETLEQIIRRGSVGVDDVRAVAIDLARGLAHAHSRGVIHRDLKPANVIVTPDGTAKILDFGLARRSGTSGPTLPGVALGTVAYMSPEQIRGETVDHRCDLWALGALLQEALTGQAPFNAPEIPAQLHRILNEDPTLVGSLRPETPDDLRRVVAGCLRKDRSERFATAEEILAALGLSTDLRQAIGAGKPARRRLRSPWLGLGLVAVAALVVVGIFSSGVFRSGPQEPPPPPEELARSVTVEDEFGQTTTQKVASSSYRQRIAIFFADSMDGPPTEQWLAQGLPALVATDLMQDPFIVAQTPFEFIELMRREGRPDGLGLSRALQRKIAREQMATAFVTYEITAATDSSLTLTQTVHETESGRQLAMETMRARDPFALADQASVALRTDLKVPEVLASEYPDLPVSELSTESREAFREYILASVGLAIDNDYAAALGRLKSAVTADSTFALAHVSMFVVNSLMQDMTGLTESADRAMEYLYRLPQKVQFGMKANYYLNIEQDPDKALAVTRMWTQLHPDDEDAYRQLAMFHMLRDEKDEQVAALEEILRIDPADFNTLQGIGTTYRDMGRYDDAARWLERFVSTYPSRASGHIELARLYVDLGERERARESVDRALLLEDRSPGARLLLADIGAREGRFDAARAQIDLAMQAAGTSLERAEVQNERSDLARRQGRIREALTAVEDMRARLAEALPPTQAVLRVLPEWHLFALIGEGDEGLARAREDRLSLAPLLRDAAGLGLAPLFTELGQADSARIYLQGVRNFADTYKLEVMRPVIQTFEASLASLEGDYARALREVDAAIGEGRSGRRQFRIRARALIETGRLADAEQTLDLAVKLDPSDAELRIERARLRIAQNQEADARAELERAMAIWRDADPDYVRLIEAQVLLDSLEGER